MEFTAWEGQGSYPSTVFFKSILIDMSCNVNKTVCMMFKPKRQSSIIRAQFPPFRIGANCVQYVSDFRYLGHLIMDNLSDDDDIRREI